MGYWRNQDTRKATLWTRNRPQVPWTPTATDWRIFLKGLLFTPSEGNCVKKTAFISVLKEDETHAILSKMKSPSACMEMVSESTHAKTKEWWSSLQVNFFFALSKAVVHWSLPFAEATVASIWTCWSCDCPSGVGLSAGCEVTSFSFGCEAISGQAAADKLNRTWDLSFFVIEVPWPIISFLGVCKKVIFNNHQCKSFCTEQVCIEIAFWVFFREVLGLSLSRHTGFPEWGFSQFSSVTLIKCRSGILN